MSPRKPDAWWKFRMRVSLPLVLILMLAPVLGCRRPVPETPEPPSTTRPAVAPPRQPEPPEPRGPLLPGQDSRVSPSSAVPDDFRRSADVEVFGNYETAGVIVTEPADISGNLHRARCYLNHGGKWKAAHDLVRSGSTRNFLGSLFWLKAASTYQVKVVFEDVDGFALKTLYGEGSTRAEPAIPAPGRTIVVAQSGANENPGTIDRPLRTLAKAITIAEAGTHILLRKGTYYEGDLVFPKNGTAKAPIVIRSYPDEFAWIDAADPALMNASAWADAGDGIYTHPFEGICFNVTLRDARTGERVRLLPLKTPGELRNRTVNGHGHFKKLGMEGAFCTDGSTAYLLPPKRLENYEINIALRTKGLRLENRRHIVFDNIGVRHFGRGHYSTAAYLYRSSDITFQNCKFGYNDTVIWLKMESDRVTVQDCEFEEGVFDWPYGMLKSGGALASYETGAVYVDSKFSGRGLVIRRNRIEGLFDGAHLTSWTVNTATMWWRGRSRRRSSSISSQQPTTGHRPASIWRAAVL